MLRVESDAEAPSILDKWRLVDLFLEYKGLVTQHIETWLACLEPSETQDSYNYFVQPGVGTSASFRAF